MTKSQDLIELDADVLDLVSGGDGARIDPNGGHLDGAGSIINPDG